MPSCGRVVFSGSINSGFGERLYRLRKLQRLMVGYKASDLAASFTRLMPTFYRYTFGQFTVVIQKVLPAFHSTNKSYNVILLKNNYLLGGGCAQ